MKNAAVVLMFAFLSVAYLHPAFVPVWQGQTSQVMSDGTDSATLPYYYGYLRELWSERPSDLFYGAVPARHLNAPEGYALWIPMSERVLALVISAFTPLEHISTVYVAVLMFLNALCMYALGRQWGWPRAVALGLAIAWAFCPFTRARAQVHAGYAGTYHLPLTLLALGWATRGQDSRSWIKAALGFLAVAMAPHYFVVTLIFVSPFVFLLQFFSGERLRLQALGRMALALLPTILFLSWTYLSPLPADQLAAGVVGQPPSGKAAVGEAHSFLTHYAAQPLDYFTGDIALGSRDVLTARSELTELALSHLEFSNPHEKANGIRWVIWILFFASLFYWPKGQRALRVCILAFGLFAFWLSFSPSVIDGLSGPSYWLYSLVPQVRVPSRAGIMVHFALLLAVGFFLRDRQSAFLWLVPLLVLADFPPFMQDMKITGVRPRLMTLAGENCGAGMYFPYVAGNWGVLESYYFQQEMRGHRCGLVNRVWPTEASEKVYRKMGLQRSYLEAFNQRREGSTAAVEKLVRCMPLSWLVFDPRTQVAARESLCTRLGWRMTESRVCRGPDVVPSKNLAECAE